MAANPQTLAQKIIARASGRQSVLPGEIVTCKVDLAMIHDSGGPRRVKPLLDRLGAPVWDASRIVLVSDHYTPAVDEASAAIQKLTREFARDQGIAAFYDQQGICHVVLPERGHMKPGMFLVGGDSHSPTGGAFGSFMFGIGATDMAGVLVTGETWIRVPETIRVIWDGALARGVSAKDIMLRLCTVLGMDGGDYQVIEYGGSTIAGLEMRERMTLSNMAAELGAITGLIGADEVTRDYIRGVGGDLSTGPQGDWRSDEDAPVRETHHFNTAELAPQVAHPHSPANSRDVTEADRVSLDQAYIGACTGAKLNDLHMAAEILKGRKVASGTRLLIAPASTRTTAVAAADGTLAALTEAGAILMPSGCGACSGYGAGVLAQGEVCIASTARNFKGRMGSRDSLVYLGSPYTVAASAVMGRIADPRPLLEERA